MGQEATDKLTRAGEEKAAREPAEIGVVPASTTGKPGRAVEERSGAVVV